MFPLWIGFELKVEDRLHFISLPLPNVDQVCMCRLSGSTVQCDNYLEGFSKRIKVENKCSKMGRLKLFSGKTILLNKIRVTLYGILYRYFDRQCSWLLMRCNLFQRRTLRCANHGGKKHTNQLAGIKYCRSYVSCLQLDLKMTSLSMTYDYQIHHACGRIFLNRIERKQKI